MVEGRTLQSTQLDVLVTRIVSPIDTGSIHGRGHGLLRGDRELEVTFLLDQDDFVSLRARLLDGAGDVGFRVPAQDVTAISRR